MRPGGHRQPGRARLVIALAAALGAGTLREHDDPLAAIHQHPALLRHFFPGLAALAAVYVDHVDGADCPAEKGDAQQLLLENIGQRVGGHAGKVKGFPGGLVLGTQNDAAHVICRGQVFLAVQAVLHPADDTRRLDHAAQPGHREPPPHLLVPEEQRGQYQGNALGDKRQYEPGKDQQGA